MRKMRGDVRGFAGSLSTIQDVSQQFFFFLHTGTRSKPSIMFSQGRTPQTLQFMFRHSRDVGFNKSFFCMDLTDTLRYFSTLWHRSDVFITTKTEKPQELMFSLLDDHVNVRYTSQIGKESRFLLSVPG